jgi:hypothetical protein
MSTERRRVRVDPLAGNVKMPSYTSVPGELHDDLPVPIEILLRGSDSPVRPEPDPQLPVPVTLFSESGGIPVTMLP